MSSIGLASGCFSECSTPTLVMNCKMQAIVKHDSFISNVNDSSDTNIGHYIYSYLLSNFNRCLSRVQRISGIWLYGDKIEAGEATSVNVWR